MSGGIENKVVVITGAAAGSAKQRRAISPRKVRSSFSVHAGRIASRRWPRS